MNQQARTDSTEDLLDIIRGSDGIEAVGSSDAVSPSKARFSMGGKGTGKRKRSRCSTPIFTFGGELHLGIDCNVQHISVAKFSGGFKKKKLIGIDRYPLSPDQAPGTPGFDSVLSGVLGKYAAKSKKTRIWALLRTSELDVTTFKLPKMPRGRLSSAVYWQLQKEKKFDEKEILLDYRVQGQATEDGIAKLSILACLARREDVVQIQTQFNRVGYELSGITVLPDAFLSAYKNGCAPDDDEVVANVHVDFNFTSITIFSEGNILFSRTIKFGIMSIAEDLRTTYNSSSVGDELVMQEESGFDDGAEMSIADALGVIDARILGEHIADGIPGAELTKDEVFRHISTSMERVSRQCERTLDYFAQNYGTRCGALHLSGQIFSHSVISEFLANQLGLEYKLFVPRAHFKASGKQAEGFSPVESMRFNEAVSLGLSCEASSLNLARTYRVRDQLSAKTMVSNVIALAALVLVLIGTGLFLWGTKTLEDTTITLNKLEATLASGVQVDEAGMQFMAGRVALRETSARKVCSRYQPLALVSEVSDLVPEGVRLLSLELDFGDDVADAENAKGKTATAQQGSEPKRILILDGIVTGDDRDQETLLTRLIANLESSELFHEVTVHKSEVQEFIPVGPVLHFTLEASLS